MEIVINVRRKRGTGGKGQPCTYEAIGKVGPVWVHEEQTIAASDRRRGEEGRLLALTEDDDAWALAERLLASLRDVLSDHHTAPHSQEQP